MVSVPKTMQSILFGSSSGVKKGEKTMLLDKSDPRIRQCSVRHPKFSEAVAM